MSLTVGPRDDARLCYQPVLLNRIPPYRTRRNNNGRETCATQLNGIESHLSGYVSSTRSTCQYDGDLLNNAATKCASTKRILLDADSVVSIPRPRARLFGFSSSARDFESRVYTRAKNSHSRVYTRGENRRSRQRRCSRDDGAPVKERYDFANVALLLR